MSKAAEQPEKFFAEARICLGHLKGIPVVAIEALRRDESTRDVVISILRTCYRVCHEAGLDIASEIIKQELKETAQDNLKEIMRDDRLISMEELRAKGLKLHFTENGPTVVPA